MCGMIFYCCFFLINSAYANDLIRACEGRMLHADDDTPEISCKFVCFHARSVTRVDMSLSQEDKLRERKQIKV